MLTMLYETFLMVAIKFSDFTILFEMKSDFQISFLKNCLKHGISRFLNISVRDTGLEVVEGVEIDSRYGIETWKSAPLHPITKYPSLSQSSSPLG